MNIITATEMFNTAKACAAVGEHLKAARQFLIAQQWAGACRSAKRVDLVFYAHTGASLQASKVLESSTNHADRSEAGRIRTESAFLFLRFLRGL